MELERFLLSFAQLSPVDSCLWPFYHCFLTLCISVGLPSLTRGWFKGISPPPRSFCVLISFSVSSFIAVWLWKLFCPVLLSGGLFSFWPHHVQFLWHFTSMWTGDIFFQTVCVWMQAYVCLRTFKPDLLFPLCCLGLLEFTLVHFMYRGQREVHRD